MRVRIRTLVAGSNRPIQGWVMREPLAQLIERTFSAADREVIYRLMRSRRDIHQFAPDPIPTDALLRVLDAAHQAPSVGFMQPWNFILITSPPVRAHIKALFEEINAGEVDDVPGTERQRLYRSLKPEGLLESPMNIAVTCDRRRGDPFVLGRTPVPDTDIYSTCLAIQNMWLAACAEGLGIGWVSILDYARVERLLGLPSGVRLIAYLCIGFPREFRLRPMLEEVGWRERLPLHGLVFKDAWGQTCELLAAAAAPADDDGR
ncbi:MAG TPA: 5,6-dimethylbenzimidazole synthase [Gammaproteobacteria bacterium]|nr:5,6-dimethylbenzimidazole synthase [Gammaproteobacteria bacterium]